MNTIFEAVAIDRSVAAMVRMVDGRAIATVVYPSGDAHDFDREGLSDEAWSLALRGYHTAASTICHALHAMSLHGEEP